MISSTNGKTSTKGSSTIIGAGSKRTNFDVIRNFTNTTHKSTNNIQQQLSTAAVNRSYESIFQHNNLSGKSKGNNVVMRKRIGKDMKTDLQNSWRRSKSEMDLKEFLNFENNDVNDEKTEDLLAKALKIALENKQQIFRKTEFDTEEDSNVLSRSLSPQSSMMMSTPPPGVVTDSEGLILPKKIINPCLESSDRKNLHRELMFNNKVGKSVLNQKSELQRALEKQKERQLIMQQQHQDTKVECNGLKGELSRVIMERQQKIEKKNSANQQDNQMDNHVNPELLNARAKLRTRIDTK